jgi:putative transposase
MEASEAKRLRELETENAKLKKPLADTMLDKTALQDVLQKKMFLRASIPNVVISMKVRLAMACVTATILPQGPGRTIPLVVRPAQRRGIAPYLQSAYSMSQRSACRLASLSRKAAAYQAPPNNDCSLIARLKAMGEQYPRYGYMILHAMLKNAGLVINRKCTYSVYSELGMQVRTKRRKKTVRPRISMVVPTRVNERWSLDFVHNQLADGRRIRILNVVDDYSRTCVGQLVDTSKSGVRVARYLDELLTARSAPQAIVMDNSPELTSKAMFFWSRKTGIKLNFIQPGKPTQNAFAESFNARLRDGCLNQNWFQSLNKARQIIEYWRQHYNHERRHISPGYQAPSMFESGAA